MGMNRLKIITCVLLLASVKYCRIYNYKQDSGHVDINASNIDVQPAVHMMDSNIPQRKALDIQI